MHTHPHTSCAVSHRAADDRWGYLKVKHFLTWTSGSDHVTCDLTLTSDPPDYDTHNPPAFTLCYIQGWKTIPIWGTCTACKLFYHKAEHWPISSNQTDQFNGVRVCSEALIVWISHWSVWKMLDQLISDLLMFLRWMLPPAGWTENNSYSDDDQKYLQCCWCTIQSLICLTCQPGPPADSGAQTHWSSCSITGFFFLSALPPRNLQNVFNVQWTNQSSDETHDIIIQVFTEEEWHVDFKLCDKLIDLRSPLIRW